MAYNRKNILRRIIDICDVTKQHKANGATQEWIYLNIVYPTYRISRATYYTYLNSPQPRTTLEKIEKVERTQLSIF